MTIKAFHVFAYLSPKTDLVYYVGKTKDISQRFKHHVQGAKRLARNGGRGPKNRRERWLWELAREGREPVPAILEEVQIADRFPATYDAANREALALEAAWVARLLNAGHPLTNFEAAARAEQVRLLVTATERGRSLALSLGQEASL